MTWAGAASVVVVGALTATSLWQDAPASPTFAEVRSRSAWNAAAYLFGAVAFQVDVG